MSVSLIEITIEKVEALFRRYADFPLVTQYPPPALRRRVAGLLQNLRHRDIAVSQHLDLWPLPTCIAANVRMPRVIASHQDAPRRSTDRTAGVKIRKP